MNIKNNWRLHLLFRNNFWSGSFGKVVHGISSWHICYFETLLAVDLFQWFIKSTLNWLLKRVKSSSLNCLWPYVFGQVPNSLLVSCSLAMNGEVECDAQKCVPFLLGYRAPLKHYEQCGGMMHLAFKERARDIDLEVINLCSWIVFQE